MLDLYDTSRFMNLAIEMLNHHYVRTSDETIVRVTGQNDLFLYVMPVFFYALEINNSNTQRTQIAGMLMQRNQRTYAEMVLKGETEIDKEKFRTFPLDYILKTDIESLKSKTEQ
ncbi:MAG: hypothetical protein HFH37_09860 [Lachnospiraceae bacterium]|jgi:hypothetical protein|nr:hypothetical protein [Lachnospiraceae bacterium]